MKKIAWITDSTCYAEKDWLEAHRIHVVPLSVIFGEESFKEGEQITTAEFYERMKRTKTLPKTSQPSIGDFISLYERLAAEYEQGIAVHLSSGISGTYQTSVQAAEMVGFPLKAIDSRIATYPVTYMLQEGLRLEEEGLEADAIVQRLEELKERFESYFLVDDLSHLHRGGRLNAAQFVVGSVLQIKPILTIRGGRITPVEKIRTFKKAKERIYEHFAADAKEGVPMRACVIHANAEEEASRWVEELKSLYPHVEYHISVFGPVIGTHVGAGTLGLTWYKV
ncbi:DegV family protein [Thermicanus aegyptius]|uniref:DegV family protein n=1 Tax=Thermicanus aegyptius TaxID=94009 RepID=UPI00048DD9E3|nr:DegV family protein [Thermicanus aegyptius]